MTASQTILVVAPHPDDETIGCGGTLLRHAKNGDTIHWLIVSDMRAEYGFSNTDVSRRQAEINKVAAAYGFSQTHNLGLAPTKLDVVPKGDLVRIVGQVVKSTLPTIIYLPFRGDAHSDHAAVFDAMSACAKWFRYPSIRRVLCYETLSETDFCLNPESSKFVPNSFVDITDYLDRKIEIARIYSTEMGDFPFPRSEQAFRALAEVRGAVCGCLAAESFMLLREIEK